MIPLPVDDNSGDTDPRYFHIWRWINDHLPPAEKATSKRAPKPEAIYREAEAR